jgi:hypothetical protein
MSGPRRFPDNPTDLETLRPLPQRVKPYKAAPPEETIARIQTVLRSLEFEFAELEISHYGRCCSHGLRLIDAARANT